MQKEELTSSKLFDPKIDLFKYALYTCGIIFVIIAVFGFFYERKRIKTEIKVKGTNMFIAIIYKSLSLRNICTIPPYHNNRLGIIAIGNVPRYFILAMYECFLLIAIQPILKKICALFVSIA